MNVVNWWSYVILIVAVRFFETHCISLRIDLSVCACVRVCDTNVLSNWTGQHPLPRATEKLLFPFWVILLLSASIGLQYCCGGARRQHSQISSECSSNSLSTSANLLSVTRCNISFGARGFRSAAPAIWNGLSSNVRSCETLNFPPTRDSSSFCHSLVTHPNASDSFTSL